MSDISTINGNFLLNTNPTDPTKPLSVSRTDADTPNPLAQISLSGKGTNNLQGTIVLQTMNSGTKDGPLEERMRVHTNGNVGIGVMDPKTALHIPASGLQIGDSSTATDNFHWTSNTLNGPRALRLYNGNYGQATGNLLTLTSDGNVGIGITAPNRKLDIFQDQSDQAENTPVTYIEAGGTAAVTKGAILWLHSTRGSGTVDVDLFKITNAEGTKLTVRNDGNVGIGTDNPYTKLHIVTSTGTQDSKPWDSAYGNPWVWGQHIELAATQIWGLKDGYGSLFTWDSDSLFVGLKNEGVDRKDAVIAWGDNANDVLRFMFTPASNPPVAPLEVMRITSDGRVGIGTDNPYTKLHIVTSTGAEDSKPYDSMYGNPWLFGQHIELAATQMWGLKDAYGSLFTWNTDSLFVGLKNEGYNRKDAVIAWGDDSDDVLRFMFTPASNPPVAPLEVMKLTADGNVSIKGNVTCKNCPQSSDLRYKDDIENLSGALDKILRLRGVSFRWRDEPLKPEQGKQFGLIGQEVSEILPEAVSQDERGFLSITYSSITSVLVEAMKEQQAHMDRMENKISELQGLIRDLMKFLHT